MFKKIPKVMNYYWEGEAFTYLHYLSIKSFVDLHPEWTTRVYTPKQVSTRLPDWDSPEQKKPYVGANYFHKVEGLGVEVITIDLDEFLGFKTSLIHCVQRSDLFRWKLLAEEGGGWSDSDILYTKPISHLAESKHGPALGGIRTHNLDSITEVVPFYLLNILLNHNKEFKQQTSQVDTITERIDPYLTIQLITPIGFFLASPDNTYFKAIYEKVLTPEFMGNTTSYQGMGLAVLQSLHSSMPHLVTTHPNLVDVGQLPFYIYAWNEDNLLFDTIDTRYTHPDVVGIHWFNGAAKAVTFTNYLTEHTINDEPTCTMHQLAQGVL